MEHSKLPWKLVILDDEPIIVNANREPLIAGVDDAYIIEACNNYEPLQTNFNNLMQEHEEVCAVAQAKAKEVEELRQLCKEISGELKYLACDHRQETKKLGFTDIYLETLDNLISKAKGMLERG